MKIGQIKQRQCRGYAFHVTYPQFLDLILNFKGHKLNPVLVSNTQLIQSLITIQYALISILSLRTKKYMRLELHEFGQHIMLIAGYHRTEERMK